jgi:hypothetical protein
MMPLIRLISWNGRKLKLSGFTVDASPFQPGHIVGTIRELAPAAVLIDLDKLPSHGRAVAIALRSAKSTREIPIVFAGGAPEKIERVRADLPGSVFADWKKVPGALKQAIREGAPSGPVTPYMQQWSGSSLAKKLGLKDEVAVVNPPEGFEELLGELEDGVRLRPAISRQTWLAIWFVRTRAELEDGIDLMIARLPLERSMWIGYPKRTSRYATDLTQNEMRDIALASGLVDYKICAIDADWAALKFTRKRGRLK